MLGVLLLVLPAFIKTNQNLKTILTNLSIWIAIILVLFSFYYLFILINSTSNINVAYGPIAPPAPLSP